mmetsp:Transcript_97604/g.314560  ORF Transcript_97604/g.314560 Transcript_97604/m.314560 type:complete len:259 (-) Transcript_97604:614-1390(-)
MLHSSQNARLSAFSANSATILTCWLKGLSSSSSARCSSSLSALPRRNLLQPLSRHSKSFSCTSLSLGLSATQPTLPITHLFRMASVQHRRSGQLDHSVSVNALPSARQLLLLLLGLASPPPGPISQMLQTSCCEPLHLQNWSNSPPMHSGHVRAHHRRTTLMVYEHIPPHQLTNPLFAFTLPGPNGLLHRRPAMWSCWSLRSSLFSSSSKSAAQALSPLSRRLVASASAQHANVPSVSSQSFSPRSTASTCGASPPQL